MSEERLVPSAAEFTSAAPRTAVLSTNVLQALLVACVVLWVLDVPRQLFGLALYTEQILAVCLGLGLAIAFITEPPAPSRFDWGGGAAATGVGAFVVYRYATEGSVHWALVVLLGLCLLWLLVGSRPSAARWFDWAQAMASLLICGAIATFYERLTVEMALLPIAGIAGSAVLLLLVLEASRRVSGLGFVAIIVALAVYIFISPHFSGAFQTRPVSPERLLVYLGLDINGIIGSILQVTVLVVVPFTILGQVLARTGGAQFFADIAMSAMGRRRGGAGKIAVVGSALFGMISGSAVSNVLAVGIVTIPTMIRSGFTPRRAAAIESVGSTGGQLMPPVMGASAFIMAEFLQVSYGAVCIAAAIPAFLYYACLFMHVDLEAARSRIGAAALETAPGIGEVLRSGWHFLIPIGFLVAALIYPEVFRLTPEKAAIVATALLMLLSLLFGYRDQRAGTGEILKAIVDTGRVALDIILIGAAAGIMVGILSISGLAFGMTLQLVALSGDSVVLLLLLTAALAFVLGIGLPTVSVYILTATLLAPALIKLGVTPMAAHMFVMYNGMLSMITPPVAFAAYAAANIARTDGWSTGWLACLVGWSTFVLPFLFVLTPSLLMDGPVVAIVLNLVRVLLGIYLGTAAVVGFAFVPLNRRMRAFHALLALMVVLPPEAFTGAVAVNLAGIAAAAAVLLAQSRRPAAAADHPAAASTRKET
ncbi:MAG: TRAP transporter fused permease subunit [Hyphomonadaceae bacterium]|nr:TRAP transporter fused permease subunit [Hyphomonadaceae bacterium]